MDSQRVMAAFDEPRAAAAAIHALRERGFEVRVAMPAPFEEVVKALGRPRSTLDRVTWPAALAGLGSGALLTAGSALAWPILTGSKPIVSLPPFAIICFEVAVLVGALATVTGFAVGAWRGRAGAAFPAEAFPPEVIAVLARSRDPADAERILRALGAGEVRRVP